MEVEPGLITDAFQERMESLKSVRGALTVAGLVVLAAVLAILFIGARDVDTPDKSLEVEPVPLSEEDLAHWIDAAHELSQRREQAGAPLPMSTLRSFAEWGKSDRELLGPSVNGMDTSRFLGVTLSIDEARRNAQVIEEHDQMIRELDARADQIDEAFADAPYPAPPTLTPEQETDLLFYHAYQAYIETALERMLPSIPVTDTEVAPAEPDAEAPVSKPIRWRVVNRSRYGPKVIRKR